MTRRHPQLTVEIASDDGMVDIVAHGYDAGVRLGEMIADDMVAIRLTPPFKTIMVASPEYLALHGEPESNAQLGEHSCIGYRMIGLDGVHAWELRDSGDEISARVHGTARVTDPLYARELALAGVGNAHPFEPMVPADIKEQRLCCVLPDAAMEEPGLFLYFPPRASETPKLRAFIDVARELSDR